MHTNINQAKCKAPSKPVVRKRLSHPKHQALWSLLQPQIPYFVSNPDTHDSFIDFSEQTGRSSLLIRVIRDRESQENSTFSFSVEESQAAHNFLFSPKFV